MISKLSVVTVFSAFLLLAAACSSGDDTTTASPTPLGNGNSSATGTAAPNDGGASGTDTPTPTPGALNLCQVVTQDEVQAAVGQVVGPGQLLNDGQQCDWDYTDPSDELSGLGISLAVDEDQTAFQEEQQIAGSSGVSAVSGVGDEAYFQSASIASILSFRKGQNIYDVSMNVAGSLVDQVPPNIQETMETALANYAVPNLP